MEFLRNIYTHHKKYYNAQLTNASKSTFSTYLAVLLFGVLYLAFFYSGAFLDTKTIVSHDKMLLLTSGLSIVLFILLFVFFDSVRPHLKIIWNIIIFYVHCVFFTGTLILLINYFTKNPPFATVNLEVVQWEETKDKMGKHTYAKVVDNDEVSWLKFNGHILKEVEHINQIKVELSRGIFGLAYINHYEIQNEK